MRSRPVVIALACASSIAADCTSCLRGEDRELDCSDRAEAFELAADAEGELLPEIPEKPTFPMALVLSEEGVNKLLVGVVGNKLPFAGQLPIEGIADLNFEPEGEPRIEFVDVPGCERCVVFSIDFSLSVENPDGSPGGAGVGSVDLRIPLRLETVEGDTTALIAGYDKTTVLDLDLTVAGVMSEEHQSLEGAIEILLTDEIRKAYGPTELLRFEPWTIGTNAVKLAAKNFLITPSFVDPETTVRQPGFLSLGMQTNLKLPEAVSIEVGRSLPDGVPMAVQMHPGLLFAMAERMLAEGVIPRRYNDKGEPDEGGLYGVTLENLQKAAFGKTALDVAFRVWRTEDGYCGFVDAATLLQMSLATDGLNDKITVSPTDDLRILGGEGIGELAETDEELVDMNKSLVDNFKQSLSDQIGITVNYDQLTVADANIFFDSLALTVERGAINIYLDFLILAKE